MGKKPEFTVKMQSKDISARTGELKLNRLTIRTPILWLGHQIASEPTLWRFFDVYGILVNACDILTGNGILRRIEKEGIYNFLGYDGPILMDSGGFQFQKKETIDINPLHIIDLYEKSKPDIGVILDHPLDLNSEEKNDRRLLSTIQNTEIMLKNNENVVLLPVIHGYAAEDIYQIIEYIRDIMGDPTLIGVGSLVPLIKALNGRKEFIMSKESIVERMGPPRTKALTGYYIVEIVKLIRREFPKSFLHVFGVGGVTTMHLMFSLGVDSIDSVGWRLKAAYGAIQLPGVGDRFVSPRKRKRTKLSEKDLILLEECECPICRQQKLARKIELLDNANPTTFCNRAIHNAWVFQQELKEAWNMIEKNCYFKHVEERLRRSPIKKFFDYAFAGPRNIGWTNNE